MNKRAAKPPRMSIKLPTAVAVRLEAVHGRIVAERGEHGAGYLGPLTKGMVIDMALLALERELDAGAPAAKKRKAR